MATSVKCIIENSTDFDLVTTSHHHDEPANLGCRNCTFDPSSPAPPCPILKGETLDFTTISTSSTTGTEGWVCYELQAPLLVVQICWKDPSTGDNGFKISVNALDGANRQLDPVEVTLTDPGGAVLSFEEAKSAANIVAKYTIRLMPSPTAFTQQPLVAATPVDGPTTISKPSVPSDKNRQDLLDLVEKWMPTSLNYPMVPKGEKRDLLAMSGWNKAKGVASKAISDNNAATGSHDPVTTSCGDVLLAMLTLWRSSFLGAFLMRDADARGRKPGAKDLGYYVEAGGGRLPIPGDIIVLRRGVGKAFVGSIGHIGILCSITEGEWYTADGGGGQLPDQTAAKTQRTVTKAPDGSLILRSVTDGKLKQFDGWIDLDLLPRLP